jgi:DNA polymerase I-like protein with 3'-5' exonuclease and polymerase domains
MIVALDTETYYDKDISIGELGTWHYLRHPQADLYLLSIVTDTGIEYVGHPKDFDWSLITGPEVTWISHNVGFDSMVVERLQELGHAPENIEIKEWVCTADMAAYLGSPRSLKESSAELLGVKLSKDVRDNMKGKRWDEMDMFFHEEVKKYALDDSRYCLQLFQKYGHLFPESERSISQLTRQMCQRGVPLDLPSLMAAKEQLELHLWEAQVAIPWKDDDKITSILAIRAECAKQGIPSPKSFAKDDPEADKWEDEYADKYPWIKAVRSYRRGSKHLATIQTMLQRIKPDGWMPYELKFFGAHTGRDSGSGGINLQNIPRSEVCGVDIRSKIKAPDGFTFAIVDLSQIEPRVLHWLANDTKMLKYIRESSDLYEAQARAWGLFNKEGSLKEVDPKLRFTIKQLALGLGYGMGAKKFTTVAAVTDVEAQRLVNLYRTKNPKVTRFWKDLEANLRDTATTANDPDATFPLPSGRKLTYKAVSVDHGGLTAMIPRQGKMLRLGVWGGVICENVVQAVARDIFMDCCLRIEGEGIPILMRIHDEVVCLVPLDQAEGYLQAILNIMSTPPEWADGLPLAAEGSLSPVYKK